MHTDFWRKRWDNNEIGFHEEKPNPLLVKHVKSIGASHGQTVFVPLCGKSVDLNWLLAQGFRVIGSELVAFAVQQLFVEADIEYVVDKNDGVVRYVAKNKAIPLQVFVGDIFALSAGILGKIDFIYDRGALIALPIDIRNKYVKHLRLISNYATQLLITLNYDQQEMIGPPFSISYDDLKEYYGKHYTITQIEGELIAGGLRGVQNITENVWLLEKVL